MARKPFRKQSWLCPSSRPQAVSRWHSLGGPIPTEALWYLLLTSVSAQVEILKRLRRSKDSQILRDALLFTVNGLVSPAPDVAESSLCISVWLTDDCPCACQRLSRAELCRTGAGAAALVQAGCLDSLHTMLSMHLIIKHLWTGPHAGINWPAGSWDAQHGMMLTIFDTCWSWAGLALAGHAGAGIQTYWTS